MNDFSENWQKLRLRAGGKADYLGKAWPTKREEAYHYASLSPLDKIDWEKPSHLDESAVKEKIEALSLPEVKNRLVFANGYFMSSLSFIEEAGSWTLKQEKKIREETSFEERLNFSLRYQKFSLKMPALKEKQSLQLLFLNEGENVSCHPAFEFEVAENQHLSVWEIHAGEGSVLENTLIKVKCAESSHVFWVKSQFSDPQTASLSQADFVLEKGAKVHYTLLAKGNRLEREVFKGTLLGENAILDVSGLQLVGKDGLADFNISIAHEANYTVSQQSLKTLVVENGHAVFQGKSAISKCGNKSEAHQKSDALLLSDRGIFDVKPELEIFADDVKCSHGATVGALEEQDIFYIRSRGVSLEDAKRLLLFSFVNDVLDRISDEAVHLWAQAYVFPFLGAQNGEIFSIEQEGSLS